MNGKMRSTVTTRAAAAAACAAGMVHLLQAPHHLSEVPWLGAAFILDGIAFVATALLIAAGSHIARRAAGCVAAATAIGYLVSRTAGLPGVHEHGWDPLGIATTSVEVALFGWAIRRSDSSIDAPTSSSIRRRLGSALPIAVAAVVLSSLMVSAQEPPLEIVSPTDVLAPAEASVSQGDPYSDRVKPPGCVAITDRVNLYAEQIPSADGIRLGYGLEPGKASIPGPFLELYEGDCVAITVRNDVPRSTLEGLRTDPKTPIAVSLHVHGVKYTPASDGTAHHNSFVPPGESRTFIWYAAPRVTVEGRVVSLGTAGYWWYHDHVVGTTHGTKGLESGLFGGMVVRRRGDIEPEVTHTVVMGPNATINLQHEPPAFVATEGQRTEFIVLNVGDDFHTFHLHGHNWADNRTGFLRGPADETQLIDAKTIGPSESFGFQLIAGEQVGAGLWMLHCHVQTHSDRGMATFFQVDRIDGSPLPDVPHH